jgi:hypothetical protein
MALMKIEVKVRRPAKTGANAGHDDAGRREHDGLRGEPARR